MITLLYILAVFACLACSGVCAVVAVSQFMLDDPDEFAPAFSWIHVMVAALPALGFAVAAVYIIHHNL
jgi:hypothetical protein